jgi:hypothetical protein
MIHESITDLGAKTYILRSDAKAVLDARVKETMAWSKTLMRRSDIRSQGAVKGALKPIPSYAPKHLKRNEKKKYPLKSNPRVLRHSEAWLVPPGITSYLRNFRVRLAIRIS